MNKSELTKCLSVRLSIPREECNRIVNNYLELVSDELEKGNSIQFRGFGTFETWEQNERPGRNPRTGEPYPIPSRNSVKFKPGRILLDKLNKRP